MINYVIGDATRPVGDGRKIIAHVCNDIGGWGRGFVVAISRRWSSPEQAYRAWSTRDKTVSVHSLAPSFELGNVLFVQVEHDVTVANMVAQHDIRTIDGVPPIRYEALKTALSKVAAHAISQCATVHMPRIGCGLAGGDWSIVERLVNEALPNEQVYIYDLP